MFCTFSHLQRVNTAVLCSQMDYDTSLTLGHGDENVRRKVAVFVASGGRGLTELVFCLCMAKQRERVN